MSDAILASNSSRRRVMHICISTLTIIGSDNGFSPGLRQAIIYTNEGILLIRTLGTNFSGIFIKIHTFLFKKMHLEMPSVKWRPFCLGLIVLKSDQFPTFVIFLLCTISYHSRVNFTNVSFSITIQILSKLTFVGNAMNDLWITTNYCMCHLQIFVTSTFLRCMWKQNDILITIIIQSHWWNVSLGCLYIITWWRHQVETLSALLAFVRGIHRSPMNSPHKGQWRGALMFSLICAWINGWVNNREAGDLIRHCVHYDVTVLRGLHYTWTKHVHSEVCPMYTSQVCGLAAGMWGQGDIHVITCPHPGWIAVTDEGVVR